jgi:hypothetical protein
MQKENTPKTQVPTMKGPEGNDKAPGEDPAGKPGTGNKTSLTGKKVDADLSQAKDRPTGIADED